MSTEFFRPAPKPAPRVRRPRSERQTLQRQKRLNPRNKSRAEAKFADAFHSEAYVAHVHGFTCSVPGCRRRNIECAHVERTRKNGGKWYEIAPLCGADPRDGWKGHHPEQEEIGTDAMNELYGIDLRDIAALVALKWKERTKDGER